MSLDALHKSRLLNVEERPFKRITKRLLAPTSLLSTPPTLPPTPPPDASATDEATTAHEAEKQHQLNERRQFREDALLDFAAFESSIIRIQFLFTSNEKERERYAAEKSKIQATAQAVRDNTTDLRTQLEEAQRTLALRKEYDDLAEKITSNRLLRPREDQHANLEKLNGEIAELERESQEYAQTWAERRQQFGRIIEEGMQLRRLIRDEKEEVERREGMEDGEEAEDGEPGREGGRSSGLGTPAHGATPPHANQDTEMAPTSNLAVANPPRSGSKSPVRESQTAGEESEKPASETEDAEMAEDGEVETELDIVAAPAEGLVAVEEGVANGEGDGGQMDTS